MTDQLRTLAALDWPTITCQSPTRCTRPASYILHVHAIDLCDTGDQDGNTILILCPYCTASLQMDIGWELSRLRRYGRPHCATCGAPAHNVKDIVRKVQRI